MTEHDQPTDEQLEAYAEDLRAMFITAPDPDTRQAHLSAMRDIEPAAAAPSRRRPRRLVRGTVAAAGLVLAGGSALAATGTLPEPVQNAIADAVDEVVDLPGRHDENASGGNPTNPKAAANKAEADAFTEAKRSYNACVNAARKASPSPSPAPAADCGQKPERQDFKTDKTEETEKTPRPDSTAKPAVADPPAKPDRAEAPEKTPRADKTPKVAPPGLADKEGPQPDQPD